jgi:hypothetical protein
MMVFVVVTVTIASTCRSIPTFVWIRTIAARGAADKARPELAVNVPELLGGAP